MVEKPLGSVASKRKTKIKLKYIIWSFELITKSKKNDLCKLTKIQTQRKFGTVTCNLPASIQHGKLKL